MSKKQSKGKHSKSKKKDDWEDKADNFDVKKLLATDKKDSDSNIET